MATLVMKFGGSLTADPRHINRVAQVIMAESLAWDHMLVVISAMAGTTDALNRAVEFAAARDAAGYRAIVAALREKHLAAVEALLESEPLRRDLIDRIDRLLFDVLAVCDQVMVRREALPQDRDAAMSAGERMMVEILSALVRLEGLNTATVDAASLIVTDERHLSATPLVDKIDERVEQVIRPLLEAGIVPLVTGFIGAARTGTITTLGRGGSDYTATLLAASLHADEVWMWTSVDGVMSADPALVPGSRVIPELSYDEVGELSYFGAHILHPRAVEPLLTEGIPLRVRNPFNMDHAGTLIQAEQSETGTNLKAVTAVDGVCISTDNLSIELGELLEQVRRLVGRIVMNPVIVIQSYQHLMLVLVVPTSEGPLAAENAAQRLNAGLRAENWQVRAVKVIAAMGMTTQAAAPELVLDNIQPIASAVGPDNRLLLAVNPADVQSAVRQLHKLTNQPAQITPRGSWATR